MYGVALYIHISLLVVMGFWWACFRIYSTGISVVIGSMGNVLLHMGADIESKSRNICRVFLPSIGVYYHISPFGILVMSCLNTLFHIRLGVFEKAGIWPFS